ncbi:serine hydrolase domain-containing protein [Nocardia sp. NBC_00511]|uniref:serine hydrolase domain-containing protein n=1 Tax=Nocardia sp. NBC_00511 TaxID=2903591 RepID=UPI0030E5E71C
MSRLTGRRVRTRFEALVALAAVVGIANSQAIATADEPDPLVVISGSDLLAAIQGGRLLGVPPLPALAAGEAAKLANPDYWSNYIHEVLANNTVLLPLPTDVVKPDALLPHAPIAAGGYVSALPSAPIDLRDVTYQWAGRTKTVGDFLDDTESDALEFAHDGTVVAAYFANGWSDDQSHQAWSMTKSFVSTLVGIASDQHLIDSLDDPVDKYVPELSGTAWQGTTLRNILEMRSGIEWDEHSEDLSHNTQVTEWIDLALDYYTNGRTGQTRNGYLASLPRVEDQGARFNYNSANTQVLAWMLEKLYGKPFNEVLSEQLWQPAGMEAPADIMTDRVGGAIASEELFARPRDFVRLGELMRNGGRTPEGRQVVSQQWVTAATTGMLPASDAGDTTPGGYGYQWWSGATPDGFQANGFQGQYITVSPDACLTGLRLAHTIQLGTDGTFVGQGNSEWHALYLAVLERLGGCAQ